MSETLSCRFVRKPRKAHRCDTCGGRIDGAAVRAYGGKYINNGQPQMYWYHLGCFGSDFDVSMEPKAARLLERMGKNE